MPRQPEFPGAVWRSLTPAGLLVVKAVPAALACCLHPNMCPPTESDVKLQQGFSGLLKMLSN